MTDSDYSGKFLDGVRVLLVEDNALVGRFMKSRLEGLGCRVLGPYASIAQGMLIAEHEPLEIAVLDITLTDGASYPIALALQKRGCPFVFVTGYGVPSDLPVSLRDVTRLPKPISREALDSALREELSRPSVLDG